jgi:hypothetical protein
MSIWECPKCKLGISIDGVRERALNIAGLSPYCTSCGKEMYKSCREAASPGKTDSQKRSRAQEKRAASRWGGKRQPASGAGTEKGDVRVKGVVRGECKLTRSSSYTLKLKDLETLEKQAALNEEPVFEIEFQGVYPSKRYVVLPGWVYDSYLERKRNDPDIANGPHKDSSRSGTSS